MINCNDWLQQTCLNYSLVIVDQILPGKRSTQAIIYPWYKFDKVSKTMLIFFFYSFIIFSILLNQQSTLIPHSNHNNSTYKISIFVKIFKYICVRFSLFKPCHKKDRVVKHDLKLRLWLFFPPFLVPPKNRRKKKRRMNSKNRGFKSCLSARSLK